MWNKIGAAFGLGAIAAGGFLWILRSSESNDLAPPIVIVQTPPPPPAAYVPSSAVGAGVSAPAPVSAVPSPPAAPAAQPKSSPQPALVAKVIKAPSIPPPATPAAPNSGPSASPESRPVSVSSMPALPPPNLPAPTVGHAPRPIPPTSDEPEPEKTAPIVASRAPRSVTLPAGTMITVRLRDTINTGKDSKDDPVVVTLDAPLIVNGLAIAERGSLQKGRIVELDRAGRMGGKAKLALELTQLTLSDGQTIDISTDSFVHQGERAERKDTLRKTATWAAIAASIGAMAGGGKGAAIGAGAGAAAGAGSVIFTKSPEAVLPSETRLTFRMKSPITVTEKPATPKTD